MSTDYNSGGKQVDWVLLLTIVEGKASFQGNAALICADDTACCTH